MHHATCGGYFREKMGWVVNKKTIIYLLVTIVSKWQMLETNCSYAQDVIILPTRSRPWELGPADITPANTFPRRATPVVGRRSDPCATILTTCCWEPTRST